jgi:hypothetical protein
VGRQRRSAAPRLIRQASAWRPARHPQPAALQELEESAAIRWVELGGGDLRYSEAQALLNPICDGELTPWMVGELVGADRFPAADGFDDGRVSVIPAFRTRHLQTDLGVTSVFEPVRLLVGSRWLLSCWLPPRVYRGLRTEGVDADQGSDDLYGAVAEAWVANGGQSAADLAETVCAQLAAIEG